jgi:hypothetical protein
MGIIFAGAAHHFILLVAENTLVLLHEVVLGHSISSPCLAHTYCTCIGRGGGTREGGRRRWGGGHCCDDGWSLPLGRKSCVCKSTPQNECGPSQSSGEWQFSSCCLWRRSSCWMPPVLSSVGYERATHTFGRSSYPFRRSKSEKRKRRVKSTNALLSMLRRTLLGTKSWKCNFTFSLLASHLISLETSQNILSTTALSTLRSSQGKVSSVPSPFLSMKLQ